MLQGERGSTRRLQIVAAACHGLPLPVRRGDHRRLRGQPGGEQVRGWLLRGAQEGDHDGLLHQPLQFRPVLRGDGDDAAGAVHPAVGADEDGGGVDKRGEEVAPGLQGGVVREDHLVAPDGDEVRPGGLPGGVPRQHLDGQIRLGLHPGEELLRGEQRRVLAAQRVLRLPGALDSILGEQPPVEAAPGGVRRGGAVMPEVIGRDMRPGDLPLQLRGGKTRAETGTQLGEPGDLLRHGQRRGQGRGVGGRCPNGQRMPSLSPGIPGKDREDAGGGVPVPW